MNAEYTKTKWNARAYQQQCTQFFHFHSNEVNCFIFRACVCDKNIERVNKNIVSKHNKNVSLYIWTYSRCDECMHLTSKHMTIHIPVWVLNRLKMQTHWRRWRTNKKHHTQRQIEIWNNKVWSKQIIHLTTRCDMPFFKCANVWNNYFFSRFSVVGHWKGESSCAHIQLAHINKKKNFKLTKWRTKKEIKKHTHKNNNNKESTVNINNRNEFTIINGQS